MRYSLSSRFRGTLLGAAVGEVLGKSSSGVAASVSAACQGEHLAALGTQSLIRLGRFEVDDWHNGFAEKSAMRVLRSPSDAQNAMNCTSTNAIIGTLPLSLLYHENEIKLRENLQQLMAVWGDDPVNRDGALAVGYATLQSLTEKLNRADLIPQIIAFLGESETQVAQHLAQVQTLLEQGAGLERAITELVKNGQPSTPIALAFYCFLSTLEDLQLSVRRAARTPYQPQITSAITGSLSGAYNSIAGIPATMRMVLTRPDAKPMAAWGMKTEAEMLELSDSLLAVWSGVYDLETHSAQLTPVAAISAPRVIRPR